ncbi:hypothetical protein EDB87DRAFT_1685347 [Lactarius vividus]|nr:hypothetical protein EDB87DRAFT_1685347 [Lactarius vividus]
MNPFVLLTAFIALASALTVNTPASVVTCEPLKLTWDAAGSKSPFFLSIFPAGQPGVDALKQFPPQDGDNYTWGKVDLPPNTSLMAMAIKQFSAPATVRAGSNTNCANTEVVEDKGVSSPSSSSSTTVEPGVAAATPSGGPTSSRAPIAAAGPYSSTAPSSSNTPKTAAASSSGSNVPPSQSPGVKANSAARDTSSAVIGIMTVVGVLSVTVFLT